MPLFVAAAAAVAATATVYSAYESNKASKAQERARRLQERRARARAFREARIRRAQLLQAAQNSGSAQSSGAAGAAASIQSQLAENLGFSQALSRLQQQVYASSQRSAIASGVAALASVGMDAAGALKKGKTPGTTDTPAPQKTNNFQTHISADPNFFGPP